DTHMSSEPYVMMLRVPNHASDRDAWLMTMTGCLGAMGMNKAGVGVAMNSIKGEDAKIAPLWPAVVRRALRFRSVELARDAILHAPISSARHYFVASQTGGFGLEGCGRQK